MIFNYDEYWEDEEFDFDDSDLNILGNIDYYKEGQPGNKPYLSIDEDDDPNHF